MTVSASASMPMISNTTSLGLGTAQFGLDYGISNRWGHCPKSEAIEILDQAAAANIRIIDTAVEYGKSEAVIGHCLERGHSFRIVTKTGRLSSTAGGSVGVEAIVARFEQSLSRLRQKAIYGLLIHHFDEIPKPSRNHFFDAIQIIKDRGQIQKVGVSVYDARQIDEILDRHSIDLIQVPVSLLDQRLVQSGHVQELKSRGIEVHARSVLLQGLMMMPLKSVPSYFEPILGLLSRLREELSQAGLSPLVAALGFVRDVAEVDCALIGVHRRNELMEVVDAWRAPAITKLDFATYAVTAENFIDPRRWRL